MAELTEKSPCEGLLPMNIGDVAVTEVDSGPITAIAPFAGKAEALGKAVKAAHGMSWPEVGQSHAKGGARLLWFGHAHALLMGAMPKAGLAEHAALTDQTDAWAVVNLDGAGARDVLARLTPLDLRPGHFVQNQTARSQLGHMPASVTRVAADGYQIMVFRSMAQTLIHDLTQAMHAVAARG